MGKYINGIGTTFREKISNLKKHHDAEAINPPEVFQENLVCVVDNGPFAAAGWAFDEREMREFSAPDRRPKQWMIVPNVENLAE